MSSEKVSVEIAKLSRQRYQFFASNILVDALPLTNNWDYELIINKLEGGNLKRPENILDYSPREKIEFLKSCMRNVFIGTVNHLVLFETIDDLIRYGYYCRTPVDMHAIVQGESENVDESSDEHVVEEKIYTEEELYTADSDIDKYESNKSISTSITPATCIIGWSGTGKTSSINHILKVYPQVLLHRKSVFSTSFKQVVWLKIECPSRALPKSLCISMLEALDKAAGTAYSSKITHPMSQTRAQMITANALRTHFVGLIVIDEMQNIADQSSKDDFLNFLVELTNTIQASLLFVGTPKMTKLFGRDFRILRRCAQFGSMEWGRLVPTSDVRVPGSFDKFLDRLLKYNIVSTKPLDIATREELFKYSQGIPDILIKLFFITQIEVIARSQEFHASHVKKAFELHFPELKPLIKAIREQDLTVLDRYSDINLSTPELELKVESSIKSTMNTLVDDASETIDKSLGDEIFLSAVNLSALIQRVLSRIKDYKDMTEENKEKLRLAIVKDLVNGNTVTIDRAMELANDITKDAKL